jgi:hypothetical protein
MIPSSQFNENRGTQFPTHVWDLMKIGGIQGENWCKNWDYLQPIPDKLPNIGIAWCWAIITLLLEFQFNFQTKN